MASGQRNRLMEKFAALIIVLVFILGLILVSVLAIRWARKSPRRAAFLGWGLQFLGAGMNPQPPPQERLEAVSRQTKIKKDAESGDAEG
jgi:hypothetical protein